MKKEIIKVLKDKIQANKEEWANMWVVAESNRLLEVPNESEISKAELKMQECNDRIEMLKRLLKREEK